MIIAVVMVLFGIFDLLRGDIVWAVVCFALAAANVWFAMRP